MKSRRLLAAVVLAMLAAALVLALPVTAAPTMLMANLTGEQEVPGPGDPNGLGHAMVKVDKARVCYTLEVRRIKPPTAAHIHVGPRGVAGDIVVTLNTPTDGSSSGCEAISRSLSKKLREHPARYYVNVHNNPYPDGAIRGQLHMRRQRVGMLESCKGQGARASALSILALIHPSALKKNSTKFEGYVARGFAVPLC